MEHRKGFRKLNRTHAHRKALYRNMATSLLKKERIKTTLVKAKELRRVVEKMITRARVKSIHNIRIIHKLILDKDILKKLFDEVAPRYKDRNGGYTRIIRLGKRAGDNADLAYIELVEESVPNKKKKSVKNKEHVKQKTNKIEEQKAKEEEKIKEEQKAKEEEKVKEEQKAKEEEETEEKK